jgi:hypothetical protein
MTSMRRPRRKLKKGMKIYYTDKNLLVNELCKYL